jgi:hypothetical protein
MVGKVVLTARLDVQPSGQSTLRINAKWTASQNPVLQTADEVVYDKTAVDGLIAQLVAFRNIMDSAQDILGDVKGQVRIV